MANKLPQTRRLPESEKELKTASEIANYVRRLKVDIEKMYVEIANAINRNALGGTTAANTGTGTVKMASASNADSDGWILLESGVYAPYWTDPTP